MYRVGVKVTFDNAMAMALIKAASDEALTYVGNQALQDANQYAPRDQGILESSSISNSSLHAENGIYTLRWDTPYAQYLWHGDVMYGNPSSRTYGPEKISFTSALAREEWAKYAQEIHGEDWKTAYQAALRKGVQ